MPCGKKPLVKLWDKSRKIKVVKPSKYEQNEASVKLHWMNVIRNLELSYKDEKFWESQAEKVKELVDPIIFERLRKIFDLPKDRLNYEPASDMSIAPSDQFYKSKLREVDLQIDFKKKYSMTDYDSVDFMLSSEEELEEEMSGETTDDADAQRSKMFKSSIRVLRSISKINRSKLLSNKTVNKSMSRTLSRTMSMKSRLTQIGLIYLNEPTTTDDDLEVHVEQKFLEPRRKRNEHHKLLYCSATEADMISWNSKYRTKTLEVSASDEFNKKAEILTKKIALEFFQWWCAFGSADFKSEIKRPNDIEELFQVWFDEHASRGLVLDPKILPCVLQSVARSAGCPKAACESVLMRQTEYDINAESHPIHSVAFGTCLPQEMKHIPPDNNTEKTWRSVKIPEDLRTMAYVWEEILHMTSTKSFRDWLMKRPHLPMPRVLVPDKNGTKKQPFVVPSDLFIRDKSATSLQELSLPVSEFTLELKDVLGKLMNES